MVINGMNEVVVYSCMFVEFNLKYKPAYTVKYIIKARCKPEEWDVFTSEENIDCIIYTRK